MAENQSNEEKKAIISYMTLRKLVGFLGFLFPIILFFGAKWIGGYSIQKSISAYYHTNMGDVFVGILFVVGIFLFAYKGHGLFDNILGFFSCIFALGTAICPTAPEGNVLKLYQTIGTWHFICATLFFLTLIIFSMFLFTKTHKNRPPTQRKKTRNKIYRFCGIMMLLCIIMIGLYHVLNLDETALANINPVFWLEALALWFFGISWFTKGEAILWDPKNAEE